MVLITHFYDTEPKNGRSTVTTQNDAKFLSKLLDLMCYRFHTCNGSAPAIATDFINKGMWERFSIVSLLIY